MAISTHWANVWSATDFDDPELSGYAESQLRQDTRFGIQAMAGLSLVMQLFVAILILSRGLSTTYLSTSLLFGLLGSMGTFCFYARKAHKSRMSPTS